jgi:hypothetical protein
MSASDKPTSLRCVLIGVCGGQKYSNLRCSCSSRGPNVGLNTTNRDNFCFDVVGKEQTKKKKKKKKKKTHHFLKVKAMSHQDDEMDNDNANDANDVQLNVAETMPSQTLYLSNLNEKIKIPGAHSQMS